MTYILFVTFSHLTMYYLHLCMTRTPLIPLLPTEFSHSIINNLVVHNSCGQSPTEG